MARRCGVMKCVCSANREVSAYYSEQIAEHAGALVNTYGSMTTVEPDCQGGVAVWRR